jgi:hypothetical protein
MAEYSREATGARRARVTAEVPLEEFIQSGDESVLRRTACNPALREDMALSLLARRDLPAAVIEDLSRNLAVMKHRKVQSAVVRHAHTPRHISLPVVRRMYTFELLQLSLFPALSADLRVAIEQALTARLETLSAGERLTLAHRGPGGLMSALLLDQDERVVRAALENPSMSEDRLVRALMQAAAPDALIHAVCRHSRWSLRRDIRIALLLNPKVPVAQLLAIAQSLPATVLRDLLEHAGMDPGMKAYLIGELERR